MIIQEKKIAIILAAGQGKRMKTSIQKQYLLIHNKPVLYYSLAAFEQSSVDEIIVVTGKDDISYCQMEIIDKYSFHKVSKIVEGGKERYHSVYNGLNSISGNCSCVLIHDGARPCIRTEIIEDTIANTEKYKACVVGVPVKDTIKQINGDNFSENTPDRTKMWAVQTPQGFSYSIIKAAYEELLKCESPVTDDAMVVEKYTKIPVKLIMGSYENIKITTPDDMRIAELFLKEE